MHSGCLIHILNYNYNPIPLLEALIRQIANSKENIRIILWDDGSAPIFRGLLIELRSKQKYNHVTWNLEVKNGGRSAIRQKILQNPDDGWVVSIDSDMIPDADFIDQMVRSLQDPHTVYTGHHYYQKSPPADPYLLHWNYGTRREVPAQKKDLYTHFSTGIYAFHTSLEKDLYFNESIKGYGHEDTLFGLLLYEKEIPVQRTAMKALHQGLSNTDDFIDKQLASVHNLKVVLRHYPAYKNRLIQWAHRIEKIPGATKWVSKESVRKWCIERLHRNPDQLIYLDLLKLNEYIDDNQ